MSNKTSSGAKHIEILRKKRGVSGMNIRERQERREHEILSPYASFSDQSAGRDRDEPPCDIRPCFERDRDRILHCKAFRRMKYKTQVFLTPEGDHYRTRLTHTLEVSQIARTVAKALSLNEALTEAIALGHDLGHTPFGHAGERALKQVSPHGFSHNVQSVRIVELLERDGRGMNLTKEVRDGILNHQTQSRPATLEGKIVRLSDKIAYINHDIDDAVRAKIIKDSDIPDCYKEVLGFSCKERLNTMIHDIVKNSLDRDDIIMSEEVEEAMLDLRQYMFQNVYTNAVAKSQEGKAENLIIELYRFYLEHPKELSEEFRERLELHADPLEQVVCDYIAGMTDRFAIDVFRKLKVPDFWPVK